MDRDLAKEVLDGARRAPAHSGGPARDLFRQRKPRAVFMPKAGKTLLAEGRPVAAPSSEPEERTV